MDSSVLVSVEQHGRELRKIHRASVVAICFVISLSILGTLVSQSEFGREFVRGLR